MTNTERQRGYNGWGFTVQELKWRVLFLKWDWSPQIIVLSPFYH